MRLLRLISITFIVVSSIARGSDCTAAWFDLHPESFRTLSRLKWKRYWLGQDVFLIDGKSSETVLFESREATGYCVERQDCRALLEVGPEKVRRPVLTDIPFKLQISWGSPLAVLDSSASMFELCRLPKSALVNTIPSAIKLRRRPPTAENLIEAITSQGLVSGHSSVSVPFFDDADDIIFIRVEKVGRRAELLMVVRRSSIGWWTFRPISDIGPIHVQRLIDKRLSEAEMVRIFGEHHMRWSK